MCFTHPSVRLTLLGFWEWQLTSTYQVDLGDSCPLGWQDPHSLLLTVLLHRKASADSCSIQGAHTVLPMSLVQARKTRFKTRLGDSSRVPVGSDGIIINKDDLTPCSSPSV